MEPYHVAENKAFLGRVYERQRIEEMQDYDTAAILIVYGRRRVGKTELIEQSFKGRNILKFEGIEGQDEAVQRQSILYQLCKYTGDMVYSNLQFDRWVQVFELLAKLTSEGQWTIYLEELQWLANYKHNLIAELKYVWDNYFRRNDQLRLILCGSSPSFMINKVVYSRALYNRSQFEIHLKPMSIKETQQLLGKRSIRETMDAYLTIGGIPEYLNRIKQDSSIFLGICNQSFKADSYFSKEYEKIFISSFAKSKHYREIVEYLSKSRYATRNELSKHIGVKPGGTLSKLLKDLELCGFINKYTSYHAPRSNILVRYEISDNYLMFYFKFIKPIEKNIDAGQYNENPVSAIKQDTYYQWLGYAFERVCRQNSYLIAKILGFKSVRYNSGPYFGKGDSEGEKGCQVDLIFERDDRVLTICEVRYTQAKVDVNVIESMERKLERIPNPKNHSIHTVLITANGATDSLINRHYFDVILTLEDLFNEQYW